MQIRFTPTEQDVRGVFGDAPWSGWGRVQFFLTFVPLFLLGGYLGAAGYDAAGWSCVVLAGGVALAGYEVPRWRQRRSFRTSPSAGGERSVVVDEKGIEMVFLHGHSQLDWPGFTQYRETRNFFLLFTSPDRLALWIPKRVMSANQIDDLRGLLRNHLTGASSGF